MNIVDFIGKYKNHPVLFIGTGLSLRYLDNSYTWDGLLSKIAVELKGNNEYYLDIKSECQDGGKYQFEKAAGILEKEFNHILKIERDGRFKAINDRFYDSMTKGINVSRFKIYISELLAELKYKEVMSEELAELKKTRKNIGSIITTNYDKLIEELFEFIPLIGNNILLSNPYGSVYKIHGCVADAEKIIISKDDYSAFDEKFELIRAQLLSLFIHNPIIFLGYNIGDENIKKILKTIFTYVEPNSTMAKKIRDNFLLVEYERDSDNVEITEHDIDMEGFSTIRINKIKTDNYIEIYKSLSDIQLPVSAMDVRKVQNIVKDIYAGGDIKVNITEDLDSLRNDEKIIVIGSEKTISYQYQTVAEMISNYFNIIDESNKQILTLIDRHTIQKNQYFPIFGFEKINTNIKCAPDLKKYQIKNLEKAKNALPYSCQNNHKLIADIMLDNDISQTYKDPAILWGVMNGNINLNDVKDYLYKQMDKKSTIYRKILCAYDFVRYKDINAPDNIL